MNRTPQNSNTTIDKKGAWRHENGKPCGSIYYKRAWIYFCGGTDLDHVVDKMCEHVQLPRLAFITEYNKQFLNCTLTQEEPPVNATAILK